jgi:histidinol-phosphate phosphatase family protein
MRQATPATPRRAVFLDKDGTLVEDVPDNVDPCLVRLSPGAEAAARRLHEAGYALIVVSNQSGVARGYFKRSALRAVGDRLRTLLADAGVPLAGFYECPHHPEGVVPRYAITCKCRKPRPGLLLRAAREHGLDLTSSWLVGDIVDDIEAGRRAGCRTVLIGNRHETEWVFSPGRWPHYFATDLEDAAIRITTAPEVVEAGWIQHPIPSM